MSAAKKTKRQASLAVPQSDGIFFKRPAFWSALLLVVTLLSFLPSLFNGFTNWDDQEYVVNNPVITHLVDGSLKDILTAHVLGNYHPLTLLSLALDYHFWGLRAAGYHATNLMLHLANTLLVYIWILILTRNKACAVVVGFLWGIHPMRVESVAWISARKDLLSALFYFGSLILYHFHIHRSDKRNGYYMSALVAFAAAILSKATAVTLVPVLFLMDYYYERARNKRYWLEKIPFLACGGVAGIIAVQAQRGVHAITDAQILPLPERLLLACYALLDYILKAAAPLSLSALHPYPTHVNGFYPWIVYAAPPLLAALCFSLYRIFKSNRTAIWGLLFFFLNILPILQLVPVGSAIVAERYTYLAYPGLFVAFVACLQSLSARFDGGHFRRLATSGFVILAVGLGMMTYSRCRVWKDSETLWRDALQKYPGGHPIIFYNLAMASLNDAHDSARALEYLNRGLAMDWKNRYGDLKARFLNARGNIYCLTGQLDQAQIDLDQAISYSPKFGEAYINRSFVYFKREDYRRAMDDLCKARSLGYPVLDTYELMLKPLVK